MRADDGRRYWCKSLNNFQSPRVPINEQLVARLGTLINAPVCTPQLVQLDAIAGWEIRPGTNRLVEAGWAHGCLAVESAVETRTLDRRAEDDNRVRHAGIQAIYDWMCGNDPQWLMASADANSFHSHDHGHYFAGPDWTSTTLGTMLTTEYTVPDTSNLDPMELARLADALDGLQREDIEEQVAKLPASWPIDDAELESFVDLADARRAPVAERMRALIP